MSGAIESTFSLENCFSSGIAIEFVRPPGRRLLEQLHRFAREHGMVAPTKIGPAPIAASALAPAGDLRYSIDLLPPLFVRGNYAAGAFHWTSLEPMTTDSDTVEGWCSRYSGSTRWARSLFTR